MKIALSSEGQTLESPVAERFARCPFFLLVDEEGSLLEALPNQATQAAHGAGGMAVQLLASKGVSALIAPRLGPNAVAALKAAGIRAFEASGMTCEEALKLYNEGSLKEIPL